MYVPARSAAEISISPFLAVTWRPSRVMVTPSGSTLGLSGVPVSAGTAAGLTCWLGGTGSGICGARLQPVRWEGAKALADVVQELAAEKADGRRYRARDRRPERAYRRLSGRPDHSR